MNILGISASPRRDGNTDQALRRALATLGGSGRTRFIRISDYRIKHCTGCRRCTTRMRCVIRGDDFERLFATWQRADVLLIASPVYWLGPPGAMKDFVDRSHGSYACPRKIFAGKLAGIIGVAADSGWETQEKMLVTWLNYYGARVVGKVRLRARQQGDLSARPGELKKLDRFARRVQAAMGRGRG